VSGVGTTNLTARAISSGDPSGHKPRRFPAGPLRNLAGKSDEALVKLAKQGDENAIAALYERYSAAILRYCCSILRSQQEAEDIQQEVFLHAISALRRGPGPISFRPWLYRVAHNACISHLRSRKPTVVHEEDTVGAPVREPETVQREELRQLLDDIGRLSEVQRGALLLREMDGFSYEQIAKALDLPLTTVRSTIFRARSTLQGLAEARDADCETIQAELSEMADRRGRRSRRITSHLHVCDQCRRFREGLRYRPGVLREYSAGRRLDALRNSKAAAIIAGLVAVLGAGAVSLRQTFDEDGRRAPATAVTKPARRPAPAPVPPKSPVEPRSDHKSAPAREPRAQRGNHKRLVRIPGHGTVLVPVPGPARGIDGSGPGAGEPRFVPNGDDAQRKPAAGRDPEHGHGRRGATPAAPAPGAGSPPATQGPPSSPPASGDKPTDPAGSDPSTPTGDGAGSAAPAPPPAEDPPTTQETPPPAPIHTSDPDAPAPTPTPTPTPEPSAGGDSAPAGSAPAGSTSPGPTSPGSTPPGSAADPEPAP
jgi:RNA polymerase sigma factor (sigma-70 family)